jgi:hypothetical protein
VGGKGTEEGEKRKRRRGSEKWREKLRMEAR